MRVLVLLSGGQDSTTVLFKALAEGHTVFALTIDYNQRHLAELNAARKVVDIAMDHYQGDMVGQERVVCANLLLSVSPLVAGDVQLEQYADADSLPGGIEKTFVPLRNQLFLTIAANRAVHYGCQELWIGVSQEDFGGYPDCREEFVEAINRATQAGLREVHELAIRAPLLHLSKAETVKLAASIPGCWEALAHSHTAYDGHYPPTGMDHASLLRAKGFLEADMPDPLVVRAWGSGLMSLPGTSNYDDVRREHAAGGRGGEGVSTVLLGMLPE